MPTPRKGTVQAARRGKPSDCAAIIGEQIRKRRAELRWNQETLGEKIGVGRDTISRYETGHAEIGAGELMRLAEILRVPVPFFFGAPRETDVHLFLPMEGFKPKSGENVVIVSLDEMQLLSNFRSLPDHLKPDVFEHMQYLDYQFWSSMKPPKDNSG